ncbi:TROVE domain-containing protein [Arcicella aquatica]|uniref:TROVE domain-containing protein n=1 Tax=Arcicella aquatica TaxID=217141 RepID=A0ABU5QN34_9BACT|nr:TROVE domain-containing protein [Arcicella aquatica]MEA5258320.1 TROVE domain-containing protein [Arcicella aquatica]
MKFNWFKNAGTLYKNYQGAPAYKVSPEMELYSASVTSMIEATTYEDEDSRQKRIKELMTKVSPEFVAKLAVYVRQQMYLRTVPVLLSVELAKINQGNSLVRKTIEHIVVRPDEILEVLAYYQKSNVRTGTKQLNRLSKQIQKGLANAFNNFDEYQFAKYNQANGIKLRDALFLVHPKPKDETQQGIFDKIAQNNLAIPYTWETELSALGQKSFNNKNERKVAFKHKWQELIDSQKVGYMALMRNLRNILEADVEEIYLQKVCTYLSDSRAVANSKQLPFRFLAAYRELSKVNHGNVPLILNALEQAIKYSVTNLKGFDNHVKVVIACDVSGSMQKSISPKSKVLLYDIGLLLGMILQPKCKNIVTGIFGDTWKVIQLPTQGILANVDAFYRREGEVGYSTNGYLVIQDLIKRRYIADKIMMFTDMQLWDTKGENSMSNCWRLYKKIAPNAKLYLFDLAGYGQAPINVQRGDVFLMAGWSDKIFDVLSALESGESALSMIEKIAL